MKTRFPFEISIDEKKFKLEYRELKKSEVEEVIKGYEDFASKVGRVGEITAEISTLEEKKQIKKDIASSLKGEAKASAMQEVLELIDQIEEKKKELKAAEKERVGIDDTAKKRFDLCLSGEGFEAFKAEIEDKGLSYTIVMNAVDSAIEKERVKK
ncbi:hypothetical protein [Campylobacter sp. RM16191]|uniref:hypothetical protein n=1 Tax=Campylobacter sp. RM16191 TaxID=1705728 RepID=UPI0014746FCA|nr:hypothetical protein [Campylobacter sp. RM16191]